MAGQADLMRFLRKLALLSIPLIVMSFVEVFVLPLDFFTFRSWEALKADQMGFALPGPFYPGKRLAKMERGDLAPYSAYAIEKAAVWQTDRHGHRFSAVVTDPPRIVLVGDSTIVGSGLAQEETLAETLTKKLGVNVYPYSPHSLNEFITDDRFRHQPPEIVIFAQIERNLKSKMEPPVARPQRGFLRRVDLTRHAMAIATAEIIDRWVKQNMLHFIQARLSELYLKPKVNVYRHEGRTLLFLQGPAANGEVPMPTIQDFADSLRAYADIFAARGIRFIFLPIPNKESVYYEFMGARKPTFLGELTVVLRQKGIETIDILPAFEKASHHGSKFLYQIDDSHWNAQGVNHAADVIAGNLNKNK